MWQWNSQTPIFADSLLDCVDTTWDDLGGGRHTWVIGLEAQNDVPVGIEDEGVSPHRDGWEVGGRDVGLLERAGFLLGPPEDLEVVPVEVEGVAARVDVVDDDVDDLVLLEDEGVGVLAVHSGVGGEVARAQGCVEGRDLCRRVCYVVEEGAARVSACRVSAI